MGGRGPLSTLTVGLVFGGFLVYVALHSRLEGGGAGLLTVGGGGVGVGGVGDPASFSSRMLMTHGGAGELSPSSVNSLRDTASNAGIMSAIDGMAQKIGAAAGDLSDSQVKSISADFAKQIADYLAAKLSQSAAAANANNPCNVCWRHQNETDMPVIYLVTPTYRRPEQIPDLTRMAQTLLNVPAIHWIVVEDSTTLSPAVAALLNRYAIPHTHLKALMPDKYKKFKFKPRGVANRNAAVDWIRANVKSGVVYFADDDNTYDIRLFEEMRYTKKVSMWPVGLVTKVGLSSPVVNEHGGVIDFYDGWIASRKFPVDMAGFALNVQLIIGKPDVYMPYVPGHEEDGLLKKLDITLADIEPKADRCTKILVWHTQTKSNTPANRTLAHSSRYKGTNIDVLQDFIV